MLSRLAAAGCLAALVLVSLLFLIHSPANSADGMVWQYGESGDPANGGRMVAHLTYGVPETDNTQVQIACSEAASGEPDIRAVFGADIGDLKNGVSVNLRFTGGGFNHFVPARVTGVGAEVGLTGVELDADIDDPVWKALSEQKVVDYLVPGYTTSKLDLESGSRQIGNFVEACASYGEKAEPVKVAAAEPESEETAETKEDAKPEPDETKLAEGPSAGSDVSEKEAFEAAKELGTIEAWEAFLENFPKGFRADLARAYVSRLGTGADKATPLPTPPSDTAVKTPEAAPPPPAPADIALAITSEGSCKGGRNCSVTVTATNTGDEPFTRPLTIATSLAPGGAELQGSGTPPFSCEGAGGGAICSQGSTDIAPGQSLTLPMTFNLPRNAGGQVTTCASIAWGGVPANLGAREVQRKLNELGFDAGPVDGQPGRKTEAAIRAFQQSSGIQETGEIDLPLLLALFAPGGPGDANPVNDQACAGAAVTQTIPLPAAYQGPAQPQWEPPSGYGTINRDAKPKKCSSRSVWLEGQCILKSQVKSFCGPGFSRRGSRCVSNAPVPTGPAVAGCSGNAVRIGNVCVNLTNAPVFGGRPGRGPRGNANADTCPGDSVRNAQGVCVKQNDAGPGRIPNFFYTHGFSQAIGGGGQTATPQGGQNTGNLSLLQQDCSLSGRCAYVQVKGNCKKPLVKKGNFCMCPSTNQVWKGSSCVAVDPKSGKCPAGQAMYQGVGCVSTKIIQVWNQEQKLCGSDPRCAFFKNPSTPNTCKPPLYFDDNSCWCPSNTTWNGTTCLGAGGRGQTATPQGGNCPAGQTYVPVSKKCGSNAEIANLRSACAASSRCAFVSLTGKCPATTSFSLGGMCTCKKGQTWNGTTCVTSGSGQTAAPQAQKCQNNLIRLSNGPCGCPGGTVLRGNTCVAAGGGQQTGQNQQAQRTCPVGKATNLNCTCPAGTTSQKLAAGGSGSATGQICTGAGAQAAPPQAQKCQNNLIRLSNGPCGCPGGTVLSGNRCVKRVQPKPQPTHVVNCQGGTPAGTGCLCPAGQSPLHINTARKPDGSTTKNFRCIARGVKCGPGTQAQGNKCVSVKKPGSTTTKEIFCQPGTGLVPQNGKCVCPPGKKWTGKVCAAQQQQTQQPKKPATKFCQPGQASRVGNNFICQCPSNRRFACQSGQITLCQATPCVQPKQQPRVQQQPKGCSGGQVRLANGNCACPNGTLYINKRCVRLNTQQPQGNRQPQNNQQQQIQQLQNQLNKLFSDARLKRDVEYIATRPDGLKLYSFRYLWSDETYVGVMAQDLLADSARKDAVSLHASGAYMVDYGKLGLEMVTLEDWRARGQNTTSPR